MNVGVLGGTRFLGFHLVQALLRRGDGVRLFNRGVSVEPEPFVGKVERVVGDRELPTTLDSFFDHGYDAVFDLSGRNPEDLKPVLRRREKLGRFVFCSTSSVYRTPPPVPYNEHSPLDLTPGTYGGDKALAEKLVLAAGGCVIRPQAVVGPYGADRELHVWRRLLAGKPVMLARGIQDKRLKPVWVGDVVAAMLAAAPGARDVAGPQAVTPAQYVALLAAAARTPVLTRPGQGLFLRFLCSKCEIFFLPAVEIFKN